MMRRFERTTSGSERDARGLDSDIQRLSLRETREAQRHRQETTSPTEHYDRAISPTRKLRDLLHEDGTLKLEDAKRYFRQKAHHTRAALEALKRRSRSLERHALEQHNMDGAHPRDQIAFLEKTERKLSRDSNFWEGAQRVADKIDTLNNTCIEQANYMEKMTPSSYQRGVQEAKNGLRQIGIKDHVIDRVGKDIEDVSKAIQTRITELQYSHDPADWEKIEQAKVIKKSVDHDFRKMKEDDYYDKTQNGQLQRLERYYYETHAQMEQLDHEVTNTKTLTKDIARQNLVKDIADHVKPGASEHIASLFKELVPRHEAERAAYQSLGKKDTGVDARFFNPEHWDYKLKWQRDDPQYRDFFPMREGPVCNPAAMTRIFSRYHPEIASSDRRLHKKFEEIHNAHPEGEAGKKVGWTAQERAGHLNDALERGGLDIPPPRGKVVRFEVRRGFNYNDLKACMNVRDGRGDYIPVTVGVSAYDKNTRDYNDHVIVLQKERDRRDDQGNHYIEFHAYDPYRVIKPHSGKMGLVDIQVLSHSQKRHGGIYEPGGMGANAAVVPVLHDAPGQE